MLRMTGDPTGRALPLEHRHVAHPEPAELDCGREAGRAAADDGDAHPGASRSMSASSSAAQKKPWQRPSPARVRRRRPPASTGGTGEANASRISPLVARSQKQTMRPYSGSASMREASAYGRSPASPMFGIRTEAGSPERGSSRSPASPSSARTCSASAIDDDSPVERIPPTQA